MRIFFSFYTRVPTGALYADRLQVRMSTMAPALRRINSYICWRFYYILLDINPTMIQVYILKIGHYISYTILVIPSPTSGRLASGIFVEEMYKQHYQCQYN